MMLLSETLIGFRQKTWKSTFEIEINRLKEKIFLGHQITVLQIKFIV